MTPWLGIALALLIGGVMAGAFVADWRAERAHDEWRRRWQEWLVGGMQGPRP